MKPGPRTLHAFAWAALVGALLLVFSAYLRPDVAVMLANQLWNCF